MSDRDDATPSPHGPHGPMVVLHDHLDGGVRPQTILDLAALAGIATPCDDARALAKWLTITPGMDFREAFSRFDLVISVMQTGAALTRVAREAATDLRDDGVVYAETRFAPLAHTADGLSVREVITSVNEGLADVTDDSFGAGLIACALRERSVSESVATAEAAVAHVGDGIVGFDLAGGEVGHPASEHSRALATAKAGGLGITVHAGEMDGVHQVTDALDTCSPDRIGHGWRLIDDCEIADGRITALGPTATRVRDAAIPLEICLTSNECLGQPVESHPVRMLFDAGFKITLNPDDRSITTTTSSRENSLAASLHGFSRHELSAANERAALSVFGPESLRATLASHVTTGWAATPARLVHMARRDVWEAAKVGGTYLPDEWGRDGFIHMSALHQVLSPANAIYRGATDVVALVVDAHMLSRALVWEDGTGTLETFPHLYSALSVDAVLAEVEMRPSADGTFLLPQELISAVRR